MPFDILRPAALHDTERGDGQWSIVTSLSMSKIFPGCLSTRLYDAGKAGKEVPCGIKHPHSPFQTVDLEVFALRSALIPGLDLLLP